jgi:hypothetical protein
MAERTWELKAEHLPPQRAKILAEIALSDFANDRGGMVERAAHRIADAIAKYDDLDARARSSTG